MPVSRRNATVLLWTFAVIKSLTGAEPLSPPNGPPPRAVSVILQGHTLYYEQVMFMFVPEERTREVIKDGKRALETYTVMHMDGKYFVQSLPKGSFLVFTVGGKRLSDEEVKASLAKETAVLMSPVGKLLDPKYRPLFDPAALIVYAKTEHMFNQAYVAPPAAGSPVTPTPEFSKKNPPTTMGNLGIGFLRKVGNELVLVEFDWDIVNEYKIPSSVPAPNEGTLRHAVASLPCLHWVPSPREKTLKLKELKTLDVEGNQTHGAFSAITNQPMAVLVKQLIDPFDTDNYKFCQRHVIIIEGEFPSPFFSEKYQAPPAPTECFAQLKDERLVLRRTVIMKNLVKIPITAMVDGKPVTRYAEKMETQTKFVQQGHPIADIAASDVAGKTIALDTLTERLAKESPVLVAPDKLPVHASYAERVKPETIVLAVPHLNIPGMGVPGGPLPARAADGVPPQPIASTASGQRWTFVGLQDPPAVQPVVEAAPPANGPPPRFVRIQALGDKLVLHDPQTIVGPAPIPAPAAGETPPEPQMKAVAHWNSRVVSAENFRLFEVDGRPVDAAVFTDCAAHPLIALMSDTGKRVDPVWLSIYNPGALLVYIKPEAMMGGHGQAMMTAPVVMPPAAESAPGPAKASPPVAAPLPKS